LDLFSIYQRFGSLEESLNVTLLGDLKFGRTVHSLAQMISNFPNISLNFVSPTNLQMPKHYLDLLEARGCKYAVYDRLEDVVGKVKAKKKFFCYYFLFIFLDGCIVSNSSPKGAIH
jgi:aspartate carbamoyltransferase catalytic subunit